MNIDHHMMYIINGYYGPGLHRLRSISGPHGFEIEQGIKSKGFGPRSRGYFLNLTKESIMKIRLNYPNYNYLLTENKNLQGYPAIYSNQSLTIYDISDSWLERSRLINQVFPIYRDEQSASNPANDEVPEDPLPPLAWGVAHFWAITGTRTQTSESFMAAPPSRLTFLWLFCPFLTSS